MFSGCKELKTILLPEALEMIGKSCFDGSGLGLVAIPSNVTEIRDGAFQNCYDLKAVIFLKSSKLVTVGRNVFENSAEAIIYVMPGMRLKLEDCMRQRATIKYLLSAVEIGDITPEELLKRLESAPFKVPEADGAGLVYHAQQM